MDAEARRGGVERALRPFTVLRAGEGGVVLLLVAELFVLLSAYYVLKVVREPLILTAPGAAVSRHYARGLQALLLLAIVPAYGILADRVDPGRLVDGVLAFFLVTLLAFPLLARAGVPVGFAFFVWLGIFSTMSIAQFWSLANDLFAEEEGKRLFPLIAVGGTLGAIAGAQLAARLVPAIGPYRLMVLAAAMLAVATALSRAVRRRRAVRVRPDRRRRERERGGFRLTLRDPYLLLIAGVVLALNLVNTTGDFILARIVNERAAAIAAEAADATEAQAFIGAFYGDFQTWVTVLTALVQMFLVSRLFRTIGVRGSLFVAPVLSFGGYALLAGRPILPLAEVVKVLENGVDYSLQNTTQQALFLPTSRAAKYKAKAAIDTFVVRFGDLASTGVVALGAFAGLATAAFAVLNATFAAGWSVAVAALVRRHRRLASER